MTRTILHSDANSFYASVESLYHPVIRDHGFPMSVCGDPEARHGIVLASNQIAKAAGVKTGMAIWQARQVCPRLLLVPPDYPLYIHFSKMMRSIYEEYTDRVESFGLDEAWLDISNPGVTIADGEKIAHEIRKYIFNLIYKSCFRSHCDGQAITVSCFDNGDIDILFARIGASFIKHRSISSFYPAKKGTGCIV